MYFYKKKHIMLPKLTFIYDRKGQATKTKAAVVELRIAAKNERKYISTGVKLLPKEWSNGSVVGRNDWKELNDQLQAFKRRCSEIITRMVDEGNIDLSAVSVLLKEGMRTQGTFIDYARELTRERYPKIKEGTRKHYDVTLKLLEEWRGIVSFSEVTGKNIQRMDEVLKKRGLKEISRWTYHKTMKVFIRQAMEDGLVKKNPYSRIDIKRGGEDGLKRYLTPDEFRRFEECNIPLGKLERVRDLFVFQTYTMMSYSDLAAFRYAKCEKIGGQVIYKANRQKNGQEFTVVLLEPAIRILKKYKNRLPIISNVKYNDYLKAAVTYAKIDKQVTTHWARHTGATMLLNEGKVPLHIIQHILGHASIRETERTYAKVMDETIIESMVNYQKKIEVK